MRFKFFLNDFVEAVVVLNVILCKFFSRDMLYIHICNHLHNRAHVCNVHYVIYPFWSLIRLTKYLVINIHLSLSSNNVAQLFMHMIVRHIFIYEHTMSIWSYVLHSYMNICPTMNIIWAYILHSDMKGCKVTKYNFNQLKLNQQKY